MLTVVFAIQPSNKTFRTKMKLAKALKQNRPIPQWFRLKSDTKIQVLGRVGFDVVELPTEHGVVFALVQRQEAALETNEARHLIKTTRLPTRFVFSSHLASLYLMRCSPDPLLGDHILLPVCQCNQPVFFLGMFYDPKCRNR